MHAPAPGDRRALLVGVQHPLDTSLPARPGTCAALRRAAVRLQRSGWTVRTLLDDAAEDRRRPLLGNVLDELDWLGGGEAGLALFSMAVRDGRLYPRDGRADRVARTTIALSELVTELPAHVALILDSAAAPEALEGVAGGLVAASEGELPLATPAGPTRFLQGVTRALAPAKAGLDAQAFVDAVQEHASREDGPTPWVIGPLPDPLLGAAGDHARQCESCDAEIDDLRATFCPACGASLDVTELLDNGRYRLLGRLGAGGMGQVFLAEDTRLKVRRAVKLLALPRDLPPDEAAILRARMIQEARAAQILAEYSHHVVRVFDVGFAPERGEPYLVMELLDGVTLTDHLAQRRLSPAEAMALARTIARCLAVAHERGFVHRDLKPDNIMLCERDGQAGFIKLLDFGLVKAEQAEVKTESGRMMGTLQYMPPEQLRGQPVDARADVFSFGAVLFECFSGQRANPGRTQREIFAVLLDKGVRSLAEAAPTLPPPLIALVDACLKLDRDARPADASAIMRALEAVEVPEELPASGFAHTLPSANRSAPSPSLANGEVSVPPLPGPKRRVWPFAVLGAAAVAAIVAFTVQPPEDPRPADARPSVVAQPALPDAALPIDAAPPTAPEPLRLPTRLPDQPQAKVRSTADGLEFSGPDALVAAVRAAALGPTPRGEALWSRAPASIRAWLAAGVPLPDLRRTAAGVLAPKAAVDAPPAQRIRVRGLGILWQDGARPPVFESSRCPRIREGDRLFTASWTMTGYTGGRCGGVQCVERLERALQRGRSVGERLRLKLTVSRGSDAGDRLDIGCSVGP